MFPSLPTDPGILTNCGWSDFEPYYTDLIDRNLTADTASEFLADWTALSEAIDEAFTRLSVAITVNTADEEAERRYHTYLDTIYPPSEEADQKLKEKLLTSGIEPSGFHMPLQKMRWQSEIFREENLPLMTEEHKASTRYDKIVGSQTVNWEGKEITVTQLRPVMQNPDRNLREKAWRVGLERQLADREQIGVLWREFMALRQKMAKNAGFSDYRSFRWKQLLRFDYTPADCVRFQNAIEKIAVPAAARIYERRRKLLGLNTLRPWDLDVDPFGKPPLKPFQDVSELVTGVYEIFRRLDSTLGIHFRIMADEGLLDLENRKNKAPGGYCTEFPAARRPFIFMNAVGLHDDVQTLLHESGHAFHAFERDRLPYYQQRQVGMEFSEVASMGMELLASPYLAIREGGFYSEADAARARIEHLEKSIVFWPYMASVDAFQHWVYENPEQAVDPGQCDLQWKRIYERFTPWLDWSGLDQALLTGWQRKLHIHVVPFYYVEYGLAQLGAVQIWKNSLSDRATAVAAYRHALSLGGTVPLPELFSGAGAKFAFDEETLNSAISLMERVAGELSGT
ncbi:MAG TPA: M3 family oligoendopeptidase [Desulfomonilaceae bacterium]|nr:M3 family oligoendopeptidase [Desulfomonilaceae bacterium]